jgi:hypothetical protein
VQSWAIVFGTQPPSDVPHTPGVPPPPHVPTSHVPQLAMTPPHPSPCAPQLKPCSAQVIGVQVAPPSFVPQTPGLPPPPHVSAPLHVPQLAMLPPHPSPCAPQLKPWSAHVLGVQLASAIPHRLGPPPPHVSGAVHVPH